MDGRSKTEGGACDRGLGQKYLIQMLSGTQGLSKPRVGEVSWESKTPPS